MKIRWNWGTWAMTGLAGLMLMIILLVVRMAQEDVSLVEKDYYPRGLAYQELIDKVGNTLPYASEIVVSHENDTILVAFPGFFRPEGVEGVVHFYHRVTDAKDAYARLRLGEDGVFAYPSHEMKGRYILKIDWTQDGAAYYTEKSITLE